MVTASEITQGALTGTPAASQLNITQEDKQKVAGAALLGTGAAASQAAAKTAENAAEKLDGRVNHIMGQATQMAASGDFLSHPQEQRNIGGQLLADLTGTTEKENDSALASAFAKELAY